MQDGIEKSTNLNVLLRHFKCRNYFSICIWWYVALTRNNTILLYFPIYPVAVCKGIGIANWRVALIEAQGKKVYIYIYIYTF